MSTRLARFAILAPHSACGVALASRDGHSEAREVVDRQKGGFNACGGIYNICFVQRTLAVIQQVYGLRNQKGKKAQATSTDIPFVTSPLLNESCRMPFVFVSLR